MINPISWAYSSLIEKLWDASGVIADNWLAVYDDWEQFTSAFHSVASETFAAFFDFISSSLGFFNNFLFDFIFTDLFGSCRFYGTQILNYFFYSFASKPFDFSVIEAVVGFTFVLYCLRLIINVIRG